MIARITGRYCVHVAVLSWIPTAGSNHHDFDEQLGAITLARPQATPIKPVEKAPVSPQVPLFTSTEPVHSLLVLVEVDISPVAVRVDQDRSRSGDHRQNRVSSSPGRRPEFDSKGGGCSWPPATRTMIRESWSPANGRIKHPHLAAIRAAERHAAFRRERGRRRWLYLSAHRPPRSVCVLVR